MQVVNSSGTVLDSNLLDNSTSATHYGINGANDDWNFIFIGSGGLSYSYSFEDSTSLPPGGWTLNNIAGQTGWEYGSICANYTGGPSSFPSPNTGFATNVCGSYDNSADNSLITPNYFVPIGASARFVWKHWICALKVITTEVRYTFQSMGAVGLKHTEVMQIILPGMTEHCYMEHIQAWMYGMARYILPAPSPLMQVQQIYHG